MRGAISVVPNKLQWQHDRCHRAAARIRIPLKLQLAAKQGLTAMMVSNHVTVPLGHTMSQATYLSPGDGLNRFQVRHSTSVQLRPACS